VRALVLTLAAAYLATMVGVAAIGLVPTVPWGFLALMTMVVLPLAIFLAEIGYLVEARCARHHVPLVPIALALGVAVTWLHRLQAPLVQIVAAGILLWMGVGIARRRVAWIGPVVWSLGVLTLGYGTIWNLNYVAARAAVGSVHDAVLRDIDLAWYGWLGGRPLTTIRGLFPLTDSRATFTLLENAYAMLFTEVGLVIFVLIRARASLPRFFVTLFSCYAIGLLVFVVYPTVGPCIFEPDSFRAAFHDTFTYTLMQRMAQEYAAVGGGATGKGAAYFVALPSLHVAVATILQRALAVSRAHFWMMAPVNLFLVVSTVVLGYHYLVDVPAGVAVGLLVAWWGERRHGIWRRGRISPAR
jgi:PAP2 superfamily